jgi:hypothetical protein
VASIYSPVTRQEFDSRQDDEPQIAGNFQSRKRRQAEAMEQNYADAGANGIEADARN